MTLTTEQLSSISANVRRLDLLKCAVTQRNTVSRDDILATLALIDNLHAALLGDAFAAARRDRSTD